VVFSDRLVLVAWFRVSFRIMFLRFISSKFWVREI
jgi:hypothetical protein